FDELERLGGLLEDAKPASMRARIGLRINPMVGEGAIAATSVGGRVSKFGVPLEEARSEILAAFARWPWLRGLHVHVGSQGCTVEQLISAARRIEGLVEELEARCPAQVQDVDLGGGLPVAYDSSAQPPMVEVYVAALRDACPMLMSGRYRLITEFGRAIHANCGIAVSRVEYVKRYGPTPTAVVHFGADLLMRPVYNAKDWSHEFVALHPDGRRKEGPVYPHAVAGPLCFGGDFVGRDVALPALEAGDLICARDVGAYTLSMWSRHCSRSQPLVLGASDDASLEVLRLGETPAGVAQDWEAPREGSS
ncbi:MAG: diaminopimelate decarboxylase, partial [Nannocystaceae bacterium]